MIIIMCSYLKKKENKKQKLKEKKNRKQIFVGIEKKKINFKYTRIFTQNFCRLRSTVQQSKIKRINERTRSLSLFSFSYIILRLIL